MGKRCERCWELAKDVSALHKISRQYTYSLLLKKCEHKKEKEIESK